MVIVIVFEVDRRQTVVLLAEPQDVLVVVVLVDRLVAGQVETELHGLALDSAVPHVRDPVIVSFLRVIAAVVVDDRHGGVIRLVLFAVEDDGPFDRKNVFLGVETDVPAKRHGTDGRVGPAGQLQVIGDLVFALFPLSVDMGFALVLAVLERDAVEFALCHRRAAVHQVFGHVTVLREHRSHERDHFPGLLVVDERQSDGDRPTHDGHGRQEGDVIEVHFECFPESDFRPGQKLRHPDILRVEQVDDRELFVKGSHGHTAFVIDHFLRGRDRITKFRERDPVLRLLQFRVRLQFCAFQSLCLRPGGCFFLLFLFWRYFL